ncbi:diacylglycerol kinase family lipid kinase [candidate division KSB1 bacterium]|nr:diacylglycerol kinase family lipid kinase [candidate division KSB1 bacterium]RQW02088.1 MAG: diacylglycerol kinase family lipid kinase [candidate division KSB1 bacterium]
MTTEKKWGFIINPVAGRGFARTYASRVEEMINRHQVTATIHFTERRGHATELAAGLIERGYTHIIAVGGDGTANETARGVLDHEHVTFGLVSAGTGNDFAPVIGFSEHFTDADWQIFFQEHTVKMDVGKCNENYFLNGMGLGFDAQVASENYDKDGQLKRNSQRNYWWHIVKNLLLYKERTFQFEKNGKSEKALTFMKTISIGRRFGGGYYLTPRAIANDGLLDVCLVEPVNLFERFHLFQQVPKGAHLDHKKVKYFQTDRLTLEFGKSVPHHLDGELFFSERFDICILPNKLRIIYNPRGEHYFKV